MDNTFTSDELEALFMTVMLAMNGLTSALNYTHVRNTEFYPERICNDSFAIAEAMVIKMRAYKASDE